MAIYPRTSWEYVLYVSNFSNIVLSLPVTNDCDLFSTMEFIVYLWQLGVNPLFKNKQLILSHPEL